jgi:TRAP-type mannitol/chloroaromatic compound transport system substrate-binding protein
MKKGYAALRLIVPVLVVAAMVFFTVMPASAKEGKVIKWRLASCWPTSLTLWQADKGFCDTVNKLSGGRLVITPHPAGEIVSAGDTFEAARTGIIEVAGDWPNYWVGKNSAFDLLGSYPLGLNPQDYMVWIYGKDEDGNTPGGFELYQKVYGKFGLYYIPYGASTMESGMHCKSKQIKSMADYKGLKVKMSGRTQCAILEHYGCSPIGLFGPEIYEALSRGTVECAEFCSPGADWSLGFQEISKYWSVPGYHQPASVLGGAINMKAYNALPDDLKEILHIAAKANWTDFFTAQSYSNVAAIKKFRKAGTIIDRLPDSDLVDIQNIVNKLSIESSEKNPLFAEIYHSQVKFLKDYKDWRFIAEPFTFGQTPENLPPLEEIEKFFKK